MFTSPTFGAFIRFHPFFRNPTTNSALNYQIKGVRSFSASNSGFLDHITHIRSNLSSLQDDLTFLASSNVKSQCHLLELKFKDPSNSTLSSKLSHLTNKGGELERLVYKILDNRLRYNLAKNRRITKDSSYKYGIVGVSMVCVFGSLALSLNPIFLAVTLFDFISFFRAPPWVFTFTGSFSGSRCYAKVRCATSMLIYTPRPYVTRTHVTHTPYIRLSRIYITR
ncbi:conserved hypothetical protein [Theileria orientalis strain Shintoku]|uniref:Uncharacterized protein n=1 Tax=Theileria orientalis strain Shintoku TaxID=869250 RepID=J4CCR7_THEOR|nr:conserved hypothetical protein [Theileria orientalis strain Shintoku]BAM39862.1 conserved hypothetical protein [Theileria orientalis strain Shintoku]|eukprot:XP_009690163.1 conserved hypothetical protein [Theileria orientalis strain Shintoku]